MKTPDEIIEKETRHCPFCSNNARIKKFAENDFQICCSVCECSLEGENLDLLVDRWNTRLYKSGMIVFDESEYSPYIRENTVNTIVEIQMS